jgi:regulation of enolase protein 1 (concanavalin A-like superfamily)
VTWTSAGTQAVASGATVYVGLAVCAHDATRTETATFDNVTITPTATSVVPPSNAMAQGVSPTSVQVLWQDNSSNEAGFQVERASAMDGPFTLVGTAAANATSWLDESAEPSHRYSYRVRAFSGSVFSTYSNTAIVQTPSDSPWTFAAVGAAAPGGMIFSSPPDLFLSSQSADIWGTADACHYYSRLWTGDVQLVARIGVDFNNEEWGKAVFMIRETLDAGSRHVSAGMTPRIGAIALHRPVTNGETTMTAHDWGIGTPGWVRLTRHGDAFTTEASNDGAAWREISSVTLALPATVRVGFAVTSHNLNWETYAGFYSWQVRSP